MQKEVVEKLQEIIATYAINKTAQDVASASSFDDLGMDSVTLMAVLDEIEEEFGIKLDEDPSIDKLTVGGFVDMMAKLVEAKNA